MRDSQFGLTDLTHTPAATLAASPTATPTGTSTASPASTSTAGGIPKPPTPSDPRNVRLPYIYPSDGGLPPFLWVLLPDGSWTQLGINLRHTVPLLHEGDFVPALDLDTTKIDVALCPFALPLTDGGEPFPTDIQDVMDIPEPQRTALVQRLFDAELSARTARRLAGEDMGAYAYLGPDGYFWLESDDGLMLTKGNRWYDVDEGGIATISPDEADDDDDDGEQWRRSDSTNVT